MSEPSNITGTIMVSAPPMGTVIGDDGDPSPMIADAGSILVTALPDSEDGRATSMMFNLEDSKELINSIKRARRAAIRQARAGK